MAAKKRKKGVKKKRAKKRSAKKKAPKRKAPKRKAPKRRHAGVAKLSLQIKNEGRTADGKGGVYRGYLKGVGGRLDLGVVNAPDQSSARRKLAAVARRLAK